MRTIAASAEADRLADVVKTQQEAGSAVEKENAQLTATLKRYRKNLQEISSLAEKPLLSLNQVGGLTSQPGEKKIEASRMSAADS